MFDHINTNWNALELLNLRLWGYKRSGPEREPFNSSRGAWTCRCSQMSTITCNSTQMS